MTIVIPSSKRWNVSLLFGTIISISRVTIDLSLFGMVPTTFPPFASQLDDKPYGPLIHKVFLCDDS